MEPTPIIVSIITALATIITVIIQSRSTQKKTKQLIEVNDYRTHLLLLLASYPSKADEILTVAKYYFQQLDGNTFVLALFEDWLEGRGIEPPEWFLQAKKNHPPADY